MLPRVIVHNAVSVDGRLDGFVPDLGLYYDVIGGWEEDATLVGSETILQAPDGRTPILRKPPGGDVEGSPVFLGRQVEDPSEIA